MSRREELEAELARARADLEKSRRALAEQTAAIKELVDRRKGLALAAVQGEAEAKAQVKRIQREIREGELQKDLLSEAAMALRERIGNLEKQTVQAELEELLAGQGEVEARLLACREKVAQQRKALAQAEAEYRDAERALWSIGIKATRLRKCLQALQKKAPLTSQALAMAEHAST
jgi:chromosome segregation ATPase